MQVTDLYKTLMGAKSSCTFTLVAEGDKVECHYNLEAKGIFTLKLQSNSREIRERSDLAKLPKNCLYSLGITKIFPP